MNYVYVLVHEYHDNNLKSIKSVHGNLNSAKRAALTLRKQVYSGKLTDWQYVHNDTDEYYNWLLDEDSHEIYILKYAVNE